MVKLALPLVLGLVFGSLAVACRPELDDRTSRVESPRLLAVRAIPPDARPGDEIRFEALVAGPNGTIEGAPLEWAFCVERPSLAESGPVASACIAGAQDALVVLPSGPSSSGRLPQDACRLFGPDRPNPKPGEPAGRPFDPDRTGGYDQPVRVAFADSLSLGTVRIRCGLAGGTPAQFAEYERRGPPNVPPGVVAFEAIDETGARALPGEAEAPLTVAAGGSLRLRVRTTPPELYPFLEQSSRALVDRREVITASWFSTVGTMADERTGLREDEGAAPEIETIWTAPRAAGDATLWVVVRDDRGGVDWRSARVRIEP
jgi:hypothetical protein